MATVSKYALLNGSVCVNIILWDGNTATFDPAPYTAVPYNPAVHVIAPDPRVVNRATMADKMTAALAANATFLAIASPTTAQVTTQAKALTKQVDALIKLYLDQLDDTTGT